MCSVCRPGGLLIPAIPSPLLSIHSLQGDPVYGTLLMFIYGFGAGLPLLLIGHGLVRACSTSLPHPDTSGVFVSYPDYCCLGLLSISSGWHSECQSEASNPGQNDLW